VVPGEKAQPPSHERRLPPFLSGQTKNGRGVPVVSQIQDGLDRDRGTGIQSSIVFLNDEVLPAAVYVKLDGYHRVLPDPPTCRDLWDVMSRT
jgi:hypothetical protein